MLGKLIKHECRATARILPFAYLATAILFLVAWIVKLAVGEMTTVAMIPTVLFLLASIGVFILTLILCIMRYYKSMFGGEGYLTQTLPVAKSALYCSKLIVSILWLTASSILFLASLFGFFCLMNTDTALELLHTLFAPPCLGMVLFFITAIFVQMILFIVAVDFCITLANTRPFLRNNIAFSFVFYLVFACIQGALEVISMIFIPVSVTITPEKTQIIGQSMLQYYGDGFSEQATNITMGMTVGAGFSIADLSMIVILLILTIILLKKKVSVK